MFFITLEGIDGCGKSTTSKFIKNYFIKKGFNTIISREPGGEKISEKIREIILDPSNNNMNNWTEALLYIASRCQHQNEIINPAIINNTIVVSERYSDSTLVYQGYARGLGIKKINLIQKIVLGNIEPDLTFYLHITPEESVNRLKKRNKEKNINNDRLEDGGLEFFKKVYKGYEKIYKLNKQKRIKKIDALTDIENVKKQLENELNLFCKNKGI